MLLPVAHVKNGFTLVEFLVALLILTIGLLGLLETVNVSLQQNMSNKLRADAVMIADKVITADRTLPFANILATNGTQVTKSVNAGGGVVNFLVARQVSQTAGSSLNYKVTVTWSEKGKAKEHSLSTIISP